MKNHQWGTFKVARRDPSTGLTTSEEDRRNNQARRDVEAIRERQALMKEYDLTWEEAMEIEL